MQKRKDVLTTGQVAQICNVAPRTVTKWFDSGQLKGYRIPGSRDRRIPTSELIRFMKAHNIPTDAIEVGRMRILVIDSDWEGAENLANALQTRRNYEVQTAQNGFDAGLIAQKLVPHVIMINLMARDIDAGQVCKYVRTNEDLSGTKIIAMANKLGETEVIALHKKGFDAVLTDPADTQHIIRTIEEVTAIIYR
ncbi:MAG: regulator [Planctomycetota bacterium]|nr:MAG: regulator [Planctomycetota bacterium]